MLGGDSLCEWLLIDRGSLGVYAFPSSSNLRYVAMEQCFEVLNLYRVVWGFQLSFPAKQLIVGV